MPTDISRCSSCGQPHQQLPGSAEREPNGWWLAYTCPETGRATRSRCRRPSSSASPSTQSAKKPAKKPAKPRREDVMSKTTTTVTLGAIPKTDLDDADLWLIQAGWRAGIVAHGPDPDGQAALLAEARQKAARYAEGQTEHGGSEKGATKAKKLYDIGYQLARVTILDLLAAGLTWQDIRPPALDGRSTLDRLADAAVGAYEPVVDWVLPDSVDPTVSEQEARDRAEGADLGGVVTAGVGLLEQLGPLLAAG